MTKFVEKKYFSAKIKNITESTAMTETKSSAQDIENLLKQGLEAKNDRGQTALLLACESGNFEKARELISKGANVNTRDNNGKSAITIACESGQTDFVIYLLSNGAEASVLVNSTLLTREFLKEHPELVKFMTGGDHSAETFSAAPAFLFSSQAADFKAVSEYLANGGNADAINAAGQTALMLTAANDDAKCVELLIGNGANVNLRDNAGRTALMYAMQKGCDKAGELLLKNKANPNLQDKEGKTALMFAAEQGKLTSTEMLVKYEADLTLTDKNGQNALMIAAAEGQTDIVRFLAEDCREEKAKDVANRQQDTPGNNKQHPAYAVKKAVDLNARDNDGNTALMLAARNGHAETFQILARQKSVDFTLTNRAGQNIVDIIEASNDNRLKKLLEENEAIKRQMTEKKQATVLKVEQHLCKIRQNLGIQKNQPDCPAEENRRQPADNRLNFRTNGVESGDRQTTR